MSLANLPAYNPLGPSRDLPRALESFEASINNDEAYEDPREVTWRDPATETGDFFYNTHFYYAKALIDDGQTALAKAVVNNALARIKAGKIGKGREPETEVARRQLQELATTL